MRLNLTCGMCPEQYDLTDDAGNMLAYLRLRYSRFRVDVPDVAGETVYSAEWPDECDGYKGSFNDEAERREHLTAGILAALTHHGTDDAERIAGELAGIDYENSWTAWAGEARS